MPEPVECSTPGDVMSLPRQRFGEAEANVATDEWGFNCGPGALCAILGMTPAEIRPHLRDFERKRYTNPTLMWTILDRLGVDWYKRGDFLWPAYGLARIQWAGPWTQPGVPIAARYRHTHWVASCIRRGRGGPDGVWDVNVLHWTNFESWASKLVPWLLKQTEPRATGEWWLTHSVEIEPGDIQ